MKSWKFFLLLAGGVFMVVGGCYAAYKPLGFIVAGLWVIASCWIMWDDME